MKNITFLLAAFVTVSIFSTLNASPVKVQTLKKKFVIAADTAEIKPASPSFSIQILQDENREKFILVINNPLNEKLTITVKSQTGDGYSETTSLPALRKRFDLTAAEDGSYIVIVNNGKNSISRKVQLTTTTQVVRSIAVQ